MVAGDHSEGDGDVNDVDAGDSGGVNSASISIARHSGRWRYYLKVTNKYLQTLSAERLILLICRLPLDEYTGSYE